MYALAAHYLGMRSLYLEAGSGSSRTISSQVIASVRKYYPGILIVGGGVTDGDSAKRIADAGADIIVIGNMLQSADFEQKLLQIIKSVRTSL
jgi:phosphoglycerol geranylgeranyltransferase